MLVFQLQESYTLNADIYRTVSPADDASDLMDGSDEESDMEGEEERPRKKTKV